MSAAVRGGMTARTTIAFSQPGDRENAASRLFHAPIDRVFRVFTEPAYAPYLWSDNPADVTIEEMDVRPGGRFAVVVKGANGASTRFFGEYREFVPPRRVVNTFHVTLLPGISVLETDEFESVGENTRLTVRWAFVSRDDRDKMWGPDFEHAVTTSWDRIDGLLASMP